MWRNLPVKYSHFFTNLLFLIQSKQVGYFTSVQQIIHILQKRFFFYLKRVNESELSIINNETDGRRMLT